MTRLRRIILLTMTIMAVAVVSAPSTGVAATAPPATESTTPPSTDSPIASNDLLPANNDITNCIGTVESANCGSRARADGHTYLVFLALTLGLAFIGWRIARGVRARDSAHQPLP